MEADGRFIHFAIVVEADGRFIHFAIKWDFRFRLGAPKIFLMINASKSVYFVGKVRVRNT